MRLERIVSAAWTASLLLVLAACAAGAPAIPARPSARPTEHAADRTPAKGAPRPTTSAAPGAVARATEAPSDAAALLAAAIENLERADSFRMVTHDIRAYEIVEPNGSTRPVYGEFLADYAVVRRPALRVHAQHAYRYDPEAGLTEYETYLHQEGDQYRGRTVEGGVVSAEEEVAPRRIEPLSGDIYRTLVAYGSRAEIVSEGDATAVYVLEHPAWYELTGAIGFADLGLLREQENGAALVRQYVADHYPDVETIRFTIHVDRAARSIVRVQVDDAAFMTSVWSAVDRALLAEGIERASLAHYRVLDANGIECTFGDYGQVEDWEDPR